MKTCRRGSGTFTERRRKLASDGETRSGKINEGQIREDLEPSEDAGAALRLSTCESQMPIHFSNCIALGHCGDSSRRPIDLPFFFKNTLTCSTDATYKICDCNSNGWSQMWCHLGCLGKYVTGFRHPVNEWRLLFEPESRAVISLSSNTPTSSNDEGGGGCLAVAARAV